MIFKFSNSQKQVETFIYFQYWTLQQSGYKMFINAEQFQPPTSLTTDTSKASTQLLVSFPPNDLARLHPSVLCWKKKDYSKVVSIDMLKIILKLYQYILCTHAKILKVKRSKCVMLTRYVSLYIWSKLKNKVLTWYKAQRESSIHGYLYWRTKTIVMLGDLAYSSFCFLWSIKQVH